jgi:hypothetical protein
MTQIPNLMALQKVRNRLGPSFRRKPESSRFRWLWSPAFAGVTEIEILYDFGKLVSPLF